MSRPIPSMNVTNVVAITITCDQKKGLLVLKSLTPTLSKLDSCLA